MAIRTETRQARELARYLDHAVHELRKSNGDPARKWQEWLDIDDPHIGEAVVAELREMLRERPDISERDTLERALEQRRHSREMLWRLLAEPESVEVRRRHIGRRKKARLHMRLGRWLAQQTASTSLALVAVLVITVAAWIIPLFDDRPLQGDVPDLALQAIAIFVLAFLPGWMFVRFLRGRAGALWDEYVINLHRLGWDQPRNLPRPPQASTFYNVWHDDGGPIIDGFDSIYRKKFDAYYGRSTSESAQDPDQRVRSETLFPVYLATFVFAVGWTALLWDDYAYSVLDEPEKQPLRPMLTFAFLGAYVFVVQMLIRRFFQNDLKASAYISAVFRVAIALIFATVAYLTLPFLTDHMSTLAVVAFIVGFFPSAAMELFRRLAAKTVDLVTPSPQAKYPLSEIDGLNIWYDTRLLEEGIEDLQSLVTANFVDVLLHTRVPAGRLIDWVDQSYLLLHLGTLEKKTTPQVDSPPEIAGGTIRGQNAMTATTDARTALRCLGIRTATDLLCAFADEGVIAHAEADGMQPITGALEFLECNGMVPARVRALVRILADEPGLHPILNWQNNGVPLYAPTPATPHPRKVLHLPSTARVRYQPRTQ